VSPAIEADDGLPVLIGVIAFEPHHVDAHIVLVVFRELLAAQLRHVDLGLFGKYRRHSEEQGGARMVA
jgi:hypothetical protein